MSGCGHMLSLLHKDMPDDDADGEKFITDLWIQSTEYSIRRAQTLGLSEQSIKVMKNQLEFLKKRS